MPGSFLAPISSSSLLHNPDFRRFWLSAALNSFGEQVSLFAIPLCAALILHASPAQMGMLATLTLSSIALATWAGLLSACKISAYAGHAHGAGCLENTARLVKDIFVIPRHGARR